MNTATVWAAVEWRKPVMVRIGYGPTETIRGPSEAFEYLNSRWPIVEGIYHDLAEQKCRAAMERKAFAEEARDIFVSAAIEARVLV